MTTQNISDVEQNILNPLVEAAKPIFILSNTMQHTVSTLPLVKVLDRISLMIDEFAEKAEANGTPYETVQKAKYCLCTFVDELAVHADWADENWAQKSLLVSFYNETWGGERFFEMLENLKQQPEKNIDLLELMYFCLQFDYKGKYHVIPNGDLQIDKIKRELSGLFQKHDIHQVTLLPYQSDTKTVRSTSNRLVVPLWVIASLATVTVAISFFIMQRLLAGQFDATSTVINNLKIPVPEQQYAQVKISRLADDRFLADLIKRELISVSDQPDRSIITIKGDNLFESGSTQIQDSYSSVLEVIGQVLKSKEGQIIVSGYTDDRPIRSIAFPSNTHLSQKRADGVKEILTKYIPDDSTRIIAEGRGDTNPVKPNNSEENRAKNRRVEITLLSTSNNNLYWDEANTESKSASSVHENH